MKNILFVCLGNICRSSAAEGVFRQKVEQAGLAGEIMCDSAGLISYHEGEPSDPRMLRHAAQRGIHLTHLSRPITRSDFQQFDMIICMDEDNVRRIRQKGYPLDKVYMMADYLERYDDDYIPDPYYSGDAAFEHVLDLLDDACENLLNELKNK